MAKKSKKMDREQIKQFVEVYKQHNILWDVTNKDYTNKRKRAAILKEFVPILGKNATIDTVRKKIDILRSSYFREWKKVQASQGTSDVYVPTLFYYNTLCFLSGDEPKEEIKSEVDSFSEQQETDKESHLLPVLTEGKSTSPKRRKKSQSAKIQEDYVNVVKKQKKTLKVYDNGDEEDNTFGLYLDQQLQKLFTDQRTFAEKLMSDVLFMARTNQLNSTSQIITPVETNYLSDNSASD